MYVVFCVSSPSYSSVESHIYSVSPELSLLCSSIESLIPDVSPVPFFHQVSLFLEVEEKKVGVSTTASPCILSNVSEVSPHVSLRAFQVPLTIVHPRLGWSRVVKSSCVITEEPCMCYSHRKDFCCIWIQSIPFSFVGHGSFRESSRNVILVLESVIFRFLIITYSGGATSGCSLGRRCDRSMVGSEIGID